MRRIAFVLMLACVLLVGVSSAEEAKGAKTAPKEKVVNIDKDNNGVIDEKEIYNEEGKIVRKGYDTNGDGVMERWQSYDPNTGLPNIVGSDTAGELR